jgi:hypothetical protein
MTEVLTPNKKTYCAFIHVDLLSFAVDTQSTHDYSLVDSTSVVANIDDTVETSETASSALLKAPTESTGKCYKDVI